MGRARRARKCLRLAQRDDPNGPRFVCSPSEIELTFQLKIRPAVSRACRSLHVEREAIALRGRLRQWTRVVGDVRLWGSGGGENEKPCHCSGAGHRDDWSEHSVPLDI